MGLEVEKVAKQKMENVSVALDLTLQTHSWEAALLQSTKATEFLQVMTTMFVYKHLFKMEAT